MSVSLLNLILFISQENKMDATCVKQIKEYNHIIAEIAQYSHV